jgi:hypothetical protein
MHANNEITIKAKRIVRREWGEHATHLFARKRDKKKKNQNQMDKGT